MTSTHAAASASGFDPQFFANIVDAEARHFWFRSRSYLIAWALRRYFPGATRYLEVGCGTGFVLHVIRMEFPSMKLVATDLFPEALQLAARRVPDAEFRVMDARNLPPQPEFDVIGAYDVLEHIEEDEVVLSKMSQALRVNGGLVMTVPQHKLLWGVADRYAKHCRRYSRGELLAKLARAGFAVMRVTSFTAFLLPLVAVSRLAQNLRQRRYNPGAELTIPRWLNHTFLYVASAERALIQRGFSFPVGGSLLVIARRR